MAISDTDVKVIYQGNGATTTFALNQDVEDKTEVRIVIRDEAVSPATETVQIETTDFTFDADPPTNITFVSPPASTQKILVKRLNPLTQAQDFQSTGNFNPENAELALDKLTRITQELDEAIQRALKLRETSGLSDLYLPQPEANKVLGWNASATGIGNLNVSDISGSTAMLNPSVAVVSDSGGAATSSTTTASEIAAIGALSANKAVHTDGSGLLESSTVSKDELSYLFGVTGPIQSQIDDAAASGGGGFEVLPLSPAPQEVTGAGYLEYEFNANTDQIIGIVFEVPSGFDPAEKDIAIDLIHSTPATTNDTRVSMVVELNRPGTTVRATPTDTVTVNQTLTADTTAGELQATQVALTSSGAVNATNCAAGDFLFIQLRRDADDASDTNTEVWRLVKSLIQVKVIDQ